MDLIGFFVLFHIYDMSFDIFSGFFVFVMLSSWYVMFVGFFMVFFQGFPCVSSRCS